MFATATGLKLLQKLGGYSIGAMAGALLTDPTGATMPLQTMCAVLTASLIVDVGATVAESVLEKGAARTNTIATWLEELLRKHKKVDVLVEAIAHGTERHEKVDAEQAEWLGKVFAASDAQLEQIARQSDRIESLLIYVGNHLAVVSGEILAGVQEIKGILANRNTDELSDDAIAAQTADAADNAELRRERLRALLDTYDFSRARGFATRCWLWVTKQVRLAPSQRGRLVEVILDQRLGWVSLSAEAEREPAIVELRAVRQYLEELLPSLSEEEQLQCTSLVAVAYSVAEGADRGLRLLGGRLDPFAIRRRVAILCNAERYAEAVELIRGREFDLVWAERGVLAWLGNGDVGLAKELAAWALNKLLPPQQARIRCLFAQGAIDRVQVEGKRGPSVESQSRPVVGQALEMLEPAIQELIGRHGDMSRMDAELLRLYLHLRLLLDDGQKIGPVAERLAACVPFEPLLAELSRRGWIKPGVNWAQRVRTELPRSFDRDITALWLDAQRGDRKESALQATLRLVPEAATEEQKEHVRSLLMQLSQGLAQSELSEVEKVLKTLSEPDSRPAQFWRVSRLLDDGKADLAIDALVPLRDEDDPLWLQLQGQALLKQKKVADAVAALAKAATLVSGVALLRNVAEIALAYARWDDAANLLEQLRSMADSDFAVEANLATAWHYVGRNVEAAKQFADLARQNRGQTDLFIKAAECFLAAGMPNDAVSSLEEVCADESATMVAVNRLSQLYIERGNAAGAYELLERRRTKYWEEYQFVANYWSVAIAAEHEDKAHEALGQMLSLQQSSRAPQDLLVPKTLDDLIEMAKEHADIEKERAEVLLTARMPWLAIEEVRHTPAMQGWSQRTRPRLWIFENRVGQADSAVFASNGFAVIKGHGGSDIEPLEAPGPSSPVVADLTALMTLHQLGLLEKAARHCGQLHIPERYLFKMFSDHGRLRPHQPSSRTLLSRLRDLHAVSKIVVVHDESAVASMPIVDEHYPATEKPAQVRHLADLVEVMRDAGLLSEPELKSLQLNSRRPATVVERAPPFVVGGPVRISLSTLSTLHHAELLERVADKFLLHITPEDYRLLTAESAGFAQLEQIRQRHVALWEYLRDNEVIVKRPSSSQDEKAFAGSIVLASAHLAIGNGMPCLADDRVIQAMVIHGRGGIKAAFGTWELLESMKRSGSISEGEHAAACLRLIEWRYRFIVPTAELLMYWAKRSIGTLPGPELQTVARYLHSCLRDPGLLAGMEACEHSTTMALKYRQAIELELGECVARIWGNPDIPEEKASTLTEWVLTNLMPSPPVSMEPGIRVIAELWHPIFLSSFFIRLGTTPVGERAVQAIRTLASLSGMSDAEIAHRGVEVIDGLARQ